MSQWILFELVDKGYYDPRTGKKLDSIEGRRNRPNIDPFKHLGIVYPEIAQDKHKDKHIEWHEKRPKLLLKLDITDTEASRITELNAKRLTDQEAEALKRKLFGVISDRTLVHLSDLHIGISTKEKAQTRKIFNRIAKSFPKVPIIITGDLTDSASESQFRETRELLNHLALSNPILMVPGNHDYAWKGNFFRADAWEHWVKYLGSPLGWGPRPQVPWMGIEHEPKGVDGLGVWSNGPCVYFGIDSGDPKDKQITARGFISKELAKALKESLQKYVGKTRIAFLHHHPFTEGCFTKLVGSKVLLDALRENCELLVFGHQHEYGIWWLKRGIPLTVSCNKSTDTISGDCLIITVIDIENGGTPEVLFQHRLEVV